MKQRVAWVVALALGPGWMGGCGWLSLDDNGGRDDPGPVSMPAPIPMPPPPVLTRVDPEPSGSHCALGGVAIHAGLDRDRDGVLEDTEIDRTEYVCAGSLDLWTGDFTSEDWHDPVKATALTHMRVVLGSLTIDPTTTITLPVLEHVGGNLSAITTGAAIALPALRSVGGAASIATSGPVAPSFAVLERIAGDLSVSGSGGRTGLIDAPSLRELGGGLLITPSAGSDLTLPALRSIGGTLDVQGALTGLDLDKLTSIRGSIELAPRAALSVALPSLRSIGGDLHSRVSPVTSIQLPVLETMDGQVSIDGLSLLTELSMPRLSELHNFLVAAVPALTTLDIDPRFAVPQFYLSDAPALRSLRMSSLTSAQGNFIIQLTGVEALEFPHLSFARFILLPANPALRTVALPELTFASAVSIYDSPLLSSVTAPMLEDLDSLFISAASEMHTLDFRSLRFVRSFVGLQGASLPDLSGLAALVSTEQLMIERVDKLPDLRGLASLRQVLSVQITSNRSLTSLDGLENVTQLPLALVVDSNPALSSITGLQHVTNVGFFRFSNNPALADLALPGLLSVDRSLTIVDMAALDNLSGLDPLRSVRGGITIEDNALLSAEEIAAFRSRF